METELISSRTHTWLAPAPFDPTLTGLEILERIASGQIPPPPIAGTLGFLLGTVEHGAAVFEAELGEHLYNPMGTVHGGFFATMLDSALGCAVMTTLPAGRAYTTVQLGVNMVRPAFAHTGRLRCAARTVHVGRTIATAEAQITGVQDGKLYAHGTTTCAIFNL